MASSMIRAGVNLTKQPDAKLRTMAAAVEWDADREESVREWRSLMGCRDAVVRAALAFDAIEHAETVTTYCEPSAESAAWSNMEGGHTFHQKPDGKAILARFGIN